MAERRAAGCPVHGAGELTPPRTRRVRRRPGHAPLRRRRKKDHGRAEALLIAAWALGCRVEAVGSVQEPATADEE